MGDVYVNRTDSIKLKKLGCGNYNHYYPKYEDNIYIKDEYLTDECYPAPTYSEAFDWFETIGIKIRAFLNGEDKWIFKIFNENNDLRGVLIYEDGYRRLEDCYAVAVNYAVNHIDYIKTIDDIIYLKLRDLDFITVKDISNDISSYDRELLRYFQFECFNFFMSIELVDGKSEVKIYTIKGGEFIDIVFNKKYEDKDLENLYFKVLDEFKNKLFL